MSELGQVKEIMKLIEGFSQQLGFPIKPDNYRVICLGCPHDWPKKLPGGQVGIYMFFYRGKALKIGKANANTKSRFTSQHYRFNAPSTLAKSIRDDTEMQFENKENQDSVKAWIKANTLRINIMVKVEDKQENEKAVTELIEAVMHFAFRPKYEGSLHYNKKMEDQK